MYQQWLDGDRDITQIAKEDDPFWEPVEDTLIGTANIFLQSLGYVLDFDDCLTVTDFKGHEEGLMNVHVTPCSPSGRPLAEEHYVDDPNELLGTQYYFKVIFLCISYYTHHCRSTLIYAVMLVWWPWTCQVSFPANYLFVVRRVRTSPLKV